MNIGKQMKLRALLVQWRTCASTIAALLWKDFFQNGSFDPFFDPATSHRKAGVEVRVGLLRQITGHFGVEPTVFKKKRLPAMIAELVDPLAEMKASLGAAQVQMVREQVMGTLKSYLSNRQNDFIAAVYGSTVSDERRHALFIINRAKGWFDLKRPMLKNGEIISAADRRLARKIMSMIVRRNRYPNFSKIGMVVDERIASVTSSNRDNFFDMWLELRVERGQNGTVFIPFHGHQTYNSRKGVKTKSWQIIEDRETGAISIGMVTEVTDAFAKSREAYKANSTHELALDFGLTTMFATSEGDLLGQGFLTRLKALDKTISGICFAPDARARAAEGLSYESQVATVVEIGNVPTRCCDLH